MKVTDKNMYFKPKMNFIKLFIVCLATLFSTSVFAINTEKLTIFTSIPPQKFLLERIAGDLINVEVLIAPGMSPHTFEPLPQQMGKLSRAAIFFTIGIPFEKTLINRLRAICPDLKIITTDKGIIRRKMIANHTHIDGHDCSQDGALDPHIWLNPLFAIALAQNMTDSLKVLIPKQTKAIESNLNTLIGELTNIDKKLEAILKPLKNQTMLVFHPAFGYFTDRYGLSQRAIEIEGKEPGPRHLVELIRYCKKENIRVIFVQKQFPTAAANVIADTINGIVIAIDPLAENYSENLQAIGSAVASGLSQK